VLHAHARPATLPASIAIWSCKDLPLAAETL
jgi:hypothetical protein